MRRFHVSGYDLVLLAGGFPNRLTVEGELVPVDRASLVDGHDYLLFRAVFLLRDKGFARPREYRTAM